MAQAQGRQVLGRGMGRCHGEWGYRTFSHEKGILRKFSLDIPVRYPPHKGKSLSTLKKLM